MIRKTLFIFVGVILSLLMMRSMEGLAAGATQETYKELSLFGDIFERIRTQYVTKPDEKKIIEGAINGMLTTLDPHSYYMNQEQARAMLEDTTGKFGGLGMTVMLDGKSIKVVSLIAKSPAEKAGIVVGDHITQVDHQEVAPLGLDRAVKKMHGPVGTSVTLTVLRKNSAKPLEISMKRAIIKVDSVKYRIEEDVAYIRLLEFTSQTADELTKAIADIKKQVPSEKLKGYILDLRLDPGGLLDQAVKVSDMFLEQGEIVSTRGRIPESIMHFEAHKGDFIDHKPLIVLINGGTASAAEIVAGALHDQHRATIVGTRSFGKGSVQSIIPLGDNGAIRLTIALYYTPSGRSIQGKGISPDIMVAQPVPDKYKNYNVTLAESALQGHIKGKEEDAKGSGSTAYVPQDPKDDLQLKEAFALLRGLKKDPAFPPQPLPLGLSNAASPSAPVAKNFESNEKGRLSFQQPHTP